MKRTTILLLSAGALALAACSGESGNETAANVAEANAGLPATINEAAANAMPAAPEPTAAPEAAEETAAPAPTRAAREPASAPKATPPQRPKAAPRPAPTPAPSPPPKEECAPEHRAAGHC